MKVEEHVKIMKESIHVGEFKRLRQSYINSDSDFEFDNKPLKKKKEASEVQDWYYENLCEDCKKWEHSLWLVICLRIGTDKPNPEYFPHIKYLLDCPYSVGIMGGKPKQALYFIGY